jgi:CubicO group peptidase (beta-lactamase class C family)
MIQLRLRAFAIAVLAAFSTFSAEAQSLYFPPLTGATWETVSPASLGWCVQNIDTLYTFLEARNSKAFIVLKDGKIVLEKYFGAFTRDSIWYWASAGKSVTSFLVGIAQHERQLSLSDTTSRFLGTAWTSCPPEKERMITVLNQLTMTSGLRDYVLDPDCTLPSCLLYQADAGTRWAYHNAPYTLLDRVVEGATGQTFNAYFTARVKSKTGMTGLWFPSGYNNVYYSTPRSMARYGLLILNKGIWNADTLMRDTSYFRRMTNTSQNMNLSYGYLWWLNGKASYMLPQSQVVFPGPLSPDAPRDMIAALGKNGQIINVVPSQNLVMIRMGDPPDTARLVPNVFNNQIWQKLNLVICNQTAVGENRSSSSSFSLHQNYPNPFNPTTTIQFFVGTYGHTSLRVFDVLGREVAVLVSEQLSPGSYERTFDASRLSNGAYFYRLQTPTFIQTRMMELLK